MGATPLRKNMGPNNGGIFPKPWQKMKKLIGSNSKLQIGAKLGAFTPPQNNPRWGWNSKKSSRIIGIATKYPGQIAG